MLGLGAGIFLVLFGLGAELGLAVAVGLGVPSIFYAAKQFKVANTTVDKLNEAIDKLFELEHQLSTRRLDEAPYFMPDIVALLEKDEDGRTLIFCDYPAYGAISNSDEFRNYRRAVCRRAERSPVEMLCLAEPLRQKLAGERYREPANARLRQDFTADGYLDTVREANRDVLEEHFGAVEVSMTSQVMPLYFWVTETEAIFSLRRYAGDRMAEIGFRTSDKPLVDALRSIFERYGVIDESYSMVKDVNAEAVGRFDG